MPASIAIVVALAALVGRVGADARWLAALGNAITAHGSIPAGVPFAAAPSGHWPNALVLAELVFSWLESLLGDRGLMLAQLLAVGAGLSVLAKDARASGARPAPTAAALLLAALGALPALAIARMQLFSLLLFPLLVALLRAETRAPSRRIWLAVPLLALWSNLHGAAMIGLALVFAYLLLGRARLEPLRSAAIAAASVVALFLTPALTGTASYYGGLLWNVGAQSGQAMWGPLSLTAPTDLVMIACVALLAVRARRSRLALWELAVAVMFMLMTIHASRFGLWLLLFFVAPAARGAAEAAKSRVRWQRLVLAAAPVAVAATAFAVARGPVLGGASPALIAQAITRAQGSPVLAGDGIEEQVALMGGKIWVGNPIMAFSRRDQTTYLDWLAGRSATAALAPAIHVVLVARGSSSQRLMSRVAGFRVGGGDARSVIYVRFGQ